MSEKIKKHSKTAIVLGLILAMLVMYGLIPLAGAADLTSVSDTLTDSRPGVTSKQTIGFTSTTALAAGETVKVDFADGWTIPLTFVAADLSYTGANLVDAVGDCSVAASEMYPTSSNTNGSKHVTLTVCATDTVAAGAITMVIGASTTKITNPTKVAAAGTADIYTISIGGTQTDSGTAMVSVIEGISVSGTVAETLSFAIAGVASGLVVNGATTNIATITADTAVPFGTIAVGTNKIGAHDLTVSTNATGGYTTTIEYTAALTSGSDTIDDEIGTNASPDTIDAAEVFGYTTDDSSLSATGDGADRFTNPVNQWAGFTTSPLEITYNAGPASSETTRTGYQVGILGVTEAGTYTTTVIYVCTPIY